MSLSRTQLLAAALISVCVLAVFSFFYFGHRVSAPAGQAGPKIKWKASLGSRLLTAPALGPDGTVYAGSEDGLYAVSPTGNLLWKHPLSSGTHATPAVGADGTIYLTTASGSVQAVNSDGSLRWDPRLTGIPCWSPPALGTDGVVYMTNHVSDVWAFKPDAAEPKLWTLQTDRTPGLLGVPVDLTSGSAGLPGDAHIDKAPNTAPPAIGADGNLYVPRTHWLHSVSADGKERWRLFLSNEILGAVAIGQDGTVYVANSFGGGGIFAVNGDGSKRWRSDLRGIVRGSPVIDTQGNVYFGLDTELAVFSPDGNLKWEIKEPASAPVLAQDGTIYLQLGSYFAAVNGDGSVKWKWPIRFGVSPAALGTDGTIYLTTSNGELLALSDTGLPPMNSPWPQFQHDSQHTGQMR